MLVSDKIIGAASSKFEQYRLSSNKLKYFAHRKDLKYPAEVLMKMAEKTRPDICLACPVGGQVEVTFEDFIPKIVLTAPWPIFEENSLYILAHEVKHILQFKNDLVATMNKPEWLTEIEAEIFAMHFFESCNIQVPDEIISHSKKYISNYIDNDTPKKSAFADYAGHPLSQIPHMNIRLPDKNIIRAWISNQFFKTEIKNLVA